MAVLLIFLPQFLSILSNLALAKIRDTPNQARLGPINRDWAQSIGIGPNQTQSDPIGVNFGDAPNQRPDFGDVPIGHDAKNGVLLLRRACPDEPDDGKYEYYYVSYSY
jgi:hypothetical protein